MNIPVAKIHIKLSLRGDSALPAPMTDSMGEITVGPRGLLGALETQLGIPSTEVSFTTRLIQYLACIDQADYPQSFYHASYEADPFSVARTLLQWRDQWYLGGWQGSFDDDANARLIDMAQIEVQARAVVEPGLGQRIQRVIALLPENPVAVDCITLGDELSDFSHLWQALILAIDAPIEEQAAVLPQASQDSDLGKLQIHLHSASSKTLHLSGDGTVIALRANSPQESTTLTALLAQNWQAQSAKKTIAILAESRGELLDDALEANNAPRLGFSAPSPWRPVFQVLPLACELLWEPLNPTAVFQFLSHPVGPIPARVRDRLAQTVAAIPGIGSTAWETAISTALESEDEASRAKLRSSIHYWLESPRYLPRAGVDSQTLSRRARKVADWLQGAKEASEDAALKHLYNIALNQAEEFAGAIERLKTHGRNMLTQDNVRRLIKDVRGTGAPLTDRWAEVDPGQARILRADHAGAFAASPGQSTDKVIWWDCQASNPIHRKPWTNTERAALGASGVHLQSEDEQLQWLGKAWLRPILSAREQCTLVLHDDAERHHPVWDQVSSLTRGLPILQIADPATLVTLGIAQSPLAAQSLPPRVRWWQLQQSMSIPSRQAESFSSLDAYIHSPYQWLLRYAAGIRPGSLASVSDGNRLKGSLAHRLYEEFINTHPRIAAVNSADIAGWVDTNSQILLQQEGALLLEPGRQAERERFITQVQDSLSTLIEHLQAAAVVSVQMELWQDGFFAGGKLNGSIDLLATTADGVEAVVDIKWGGKKYRRDALQDNRYLQLATYAQLRRNNQATTSPALSYFIVSDAHMLNLDHSFFPNGELIKSEGTENPVQYWQRFENSWGWRKAQFDRGLVEVTVKGTEPTGDSVPDEDSLPIPDNSDTFNDYAILTGWGSDA